MPRPPVVALFGLWCLLPMVPIHAQDTIPVRVLRANPNGSFVVEIRGRDTMLAITDEMKRRALALNEQLAGLRRELALKDTLLATYREAQAWSDSTITRAKEYIVELDSLYRGYRDLAEGYRRLRGEPWLTFDGGLGATGPDHKPAILMGLGIRRLRVWGFLQEANAGGFVGVHLRLF